ncbi:KAP family P-loop NTPase fold protein [Agrobacterium rosae]|uniref:Putative P-loop ATPase n=1 Tax=Agrobacterium rosae TaxID=1972867 RepID=A0A1R3TPK4_9HYPH|nr:P-loop NTPase fold protein [Agrobacterium rosae]SCX19497.1 putative P-loop ATPase [Agrobacterium rosae]
MTDASEIWHDDLLGRHQDAEFLYILSVNRVAENQRAGKEGAFVVNVDAQWGKGKTYFLTRMYKQVLLAKHPAVFIDAWQYDFVDDPYSMVVSALDEYLKSLENAVPKTKLTAFKEKAAVVRKNFGKILIIATKEIAKTGARKVIGEGVDQIASLAGETPTDDKDKEKTTTGEFLETLEKNLSEISEAAIDKFAKTKIDNINETKRSLENFKAGLKDVMALLESELEKTLPFFIFIDELDRCKPTYSIAMLERIKHLFDVTNVVFILATDTKQMCHSINAVYGSGFDSKQYLGRFFQRSYRLPEPSYSDFANNLLLSGGWDFQSWQVPFVTAGNTEWYVDFFALTATLFGLSLRQFEQAIDVLRDINSVRLYDNQLQILYIFPFICEFVIERELGSDAYDNVVKKLKSVHDKWGYSGTSGKKILYFDYFTALHHLASGPLHTVLENLYSKANNAAFSPANRYILRIGGDEQQQRAANRVHPETPSDLSNYTNLIVHVKRMHEQT